MKTLIVILSLGALLASTCFAVSDVTSQIDSNENREIVTYQRGGIDILRCVSIKMQSPKNQVVRQHVLMGETNVVDIIDFQGKQTINVAPSIPFTIGFVHSPTGGLESVVLLGDAQWIIEAYEVTSGRLIPIAGWQLAAAREMTKDFSEFVDAAIRKDDTPTQLKARIWWMMMKAKWNEIKHE